MTLQGNMRNPQMIVACRIQRNEICIEMRFHFISFAEMKSIMREMKCALKAEEHTARVHQGCRCPFQKVPDRRVQNSETKDGDGPGR